MNTGINIIKAALSIIITLGFAWFGVIVMAWANGTL